MPNCPRPLGLHSSTAYKAVEESQLLLLPSVILPRGWDAWSHWWAVIDCPADKVPGIASAHGYYRVTVVVLICFPPELFFYPDVDHLDHTLQYKHKISVEDIEIQVTASPPRMPALRPTCAHVGLTKAATSPAIIARRTAACTQSVATTHRASVSKTRHSQGQ